MKPGKTKLTVRYHYYYGKEKCTGEKTAEYEVVPATYTLDEERGSSGMLINRGASYTCNLRTKQTTYDKSGKAVSKYVDNVAYEWYIKALSRPIPELTWLGRQPWRPGTMRLYFFG